ncbi:secondary thiamine-phosphate synthase enzyme [Bacteriovorax sp. BAL6_X]|uniref:secondary thiamine-phosphate synthase enzyme YjbQ n=1 Tax=Bacteriovorax sp. BAL6_X TaxID=1201290 RepID=UPI0003858C74|nr:secondary thiamine-phosphate synthase enzyme YjbQ [Bacteriovorax sp. BAL6_X]EPZ50699.1 secondary thiamine-phosphate synthase enzyme [Bacteriovorax sp. BAL6_X]
MMPIKTQIVNTSGEGFYDITKEIRQCLRDLAPQNTDGILVCQIQHTSAALCINEAFDPSAKLDMENFLKHLAPRNLSFITHTAEGADDSPSHMKSILMQTSLTLIVESGELDIGQWSGIYLCEFRDAPHMRKVKVKFLQG